MDAPRTTSNANQGRPRSHMATIMIAVACFGVICWSMRSLWESAPVYNTARSLRRGDTNTRRSAAKELESFAPESAAVAIPALLEAMGDPDTEVSATAARSLGRNWGLILKSNPDQSLHRAVVPRLVAALKDSRPDLRAAAAEGLSYVYANSTVTRGGNRTGLVDGAPLVRALAESVDDVSEDVRCRAVAALGTVGAVYRVPPPSKLLTALEHDPSTAVRAEAARALGQFREDLDSVALALLRALDESDPRIRSAAGNALRAIHELGSPQVRNVWPSGAIVRSLIQTLASSNPEARYHSAALLSKLNLEADVAIPNLLVVLAEPVDLKKHQETIPAVYWDPGVAAARALGRIAPGCSQSREVVTALSQVLASPVPWQRRGEAAQALAMFGPREGEPSIPVMLKVLSETKASREPPGEFAADALGRLAPGTPWEKRTVTALISALDAKWEYTRAAAARSLGRFGGRALEAIPRLKAVAAGDESAMARESAARTILLIQPTADEPGSN
jgi:HEAT repeat protein